MRPFMLRRKKDEVNLSIPPKRELLLYTGMTGDLSCLPLFGPLAF
jgi:SNF2 family DNA or RNA helicase